MNLFKNRKSIVVSIVFVICLFMMYMHIPPLESKPEQTLRIIEQTSFEKEWGNFQVNGSGADIYLDSTAQDGEYSLRFTFPVGFQGGDAPDTVYTTFSAADEVYIQFFFKLSANFQWHPITQKLIYFRCGQQQLNDTNHLLSIGYYGNGISVVTQHNTDVENMEYHWGNIDQITKDSWHKIVLHVKMNTSGDNNGILKVWFNDLLVIEQSDVLWLIKADYGGLYEFQFTPVFGGLGGSVTETMYLYFDNLIIQNGPIIPYALGSSPQVSPTAPDYLSI